ncbi:MAG: hypothetical protein IIZ78_10375 [Clostridiales bacterium]|nr:hypothetical protein [Clostridiales bacterium]
MTIKRRRINNIEVRPTKNRQVPYEIICWQRNDYYYEKDQYEQIEDDPQMYRRKDSPDSCCRVHETCFKNPESCYVIADVIDREDEEPDIKSIGKRPWDLGVMDRADFDEIVNAVFNDYYASYGNEME